MDFTKLTASVNVTMGQALQDIQQQEGPEYGYGLGVRVKINKKEVWVQSVSLAGEAPQVHMFV